jgi:hypothetical protein
MERLSDDIDYLLHSINLSVCTDSVYYTGHTGHLRGCLLAAAAVAAAAEVVFMSISKIL